MKELKCAHRNRIKGDMMHYYFQSIYPEEGTGTASTDSQSPATAKPDFSLNRGRSVSSTTDPASYDYSGHIDDQPTPRRSDTTGGTPYDL